MRTHPLDQLGEAPRPPAQLNESGELRLATRPALVDDELLRSPACDICAEVILDQGKSQIDTGRDTS
jgi:hypothetical protein